MQRDPDPDNDHDHVPTVMQIRDANNINAINDANDNDNVNNNNINEFEGGGAREGDLDYDEQLYGAGETLTVEGEKDSNIINHDKIKNGENIDVN